TRRRVMTQFLVESAVFSIVAGALGILLAMWGLVAIQSLVAAQLPPNTTLTLNWRAVAFTGLVTFATAVPGGVVPALQASRTALVETLKDSARGSSERGGRFRAALIVAEVALSVVLLVGSALLLISFIALQRTPPGFEARGAAAAFVGVPAARYGTPAQQAQFFNEVVARLEAQPRVTAAAAAT